MQYRDFTKEIARLSKETERPLAQEDVKMVFDLTKEVVSDLLKNGDHLVIRDFLKFETKTQKGKTINLINSDKKVTVPDKIVPKVSLSVGFKSDIEKVCE